ncbi:MAG: tRNA pseudouridine(38-40) synthase TruA [Acidobacteria bacterium]|jgi:tRNA pseudouridine38-40 synthase|nr:MAG: tRNA pseudouridine(38-40) synthase TruA [Acidobacteriota bacterium]GIU82882.1 MAG: tRNA pseudouridine synthase A [Pyrinomonadaceae bacterium]
MANFKLLIQYDGTDFYGWQIQKNKRTVQGELQRVLSLLEGKKVHVYGSGRTDAGVHAEGQVANVKLTKPFTPEKLRKAINANLEKDLRILDVEEVPENFHARFSAKSKTYVYRIINAPVISPFWVRYALHETRPLDISKMSEALKVFVGKHDWSAFSSSESTAKSKMRKIIEAKLETYYDKRAMSEIIEIHITGDGFLRYMVRSIVGTLLEVGRNEKEIAQIKEALLTGNKKLAGQTAPPHGLTLLKVSYD